jgi:hypothetical protein
MNLSRAIALGTEVITETGVPLGWVRRLNGQLEGDRGCSIAIASSRWRFLPNILVSTYELAVDEVVSTGDKRLIVFEGAEERLHGLAIGLLHHCGLLRFPWKSDQDVVPVYCRSDWDDDFDGTAAVGCPRKPTPNPIGDESGVTPPQAPACPYPSAGSWSFRR